MESQHKGIDWWLGGYWLFLVSAYVYGGSIVWALLDMASGGSTFVIIALILTVIFLNWFDGVFGPKMRSFFSLNELESVTQMFLESRS